MKIFAVSDIHGHFTQMREALDEAGYDKNNPDHLLVSCGDYFDRGSENKKVLQFFENIENKVIIRGNHEELLLKVLMNGKLEAHNFINGTVQTMTEFFGKYSIDPVDNSIDFSGKNREADRIIEFINNTINYYETENYVFVHGWLPVKRTEDRIYVDENWRCADEKSWHDARWTKWSDMIGLCEGIKGKKIVCGHFPTFFANIIDRSRGSGNSQIYESDGVIVLDAGTYDSQRVNVLVIEDEKLIG